MYVQIVGQISAGATVKKKRYLNVPVMTPSKALTAANINAVRYAHFDR